MFTKSTIIPYFYIKTEKWVWVTTDVLSGTYSSATSEGLSKTQVQSCHSFFKRRRGVLGQRAFICDTKRTHSHEIFRHNKIEIETVLIAKATVYSVFPWFLCLKLNGVPRDFLVFIWNMHNFLVSRAKNTVPENKWGRQFTEGEMEKNGSATHLYLT